MKRAGFLKGRFLRLPATNLVVIFVITSSIDPEFKEIYPSAQQDKLLHSYVFVPEDLKRNCQGIKSEGKKPLTQKLNEYPSPSKVLSDGSRTSS